MPLFAIYVGSIAKNTDSYRVFRQFKKSLKK